MSPLPQTSVRTRWLLPLLSGAAVGAVVIAVIGLSALRAGTSPAPPPLLRLTSVGAGAVGSTAQSATGVPESVDGGVTKGKSFGWRLQGTLPQGPASGQIHLVPAGSQTRLFVSALGSALGMSGQPQHLSGGWYLLSGSAELSVSERPGGHWVYSNHGCIVGPMLDPAVGAGCAVGRSVPPITPELGAPGAPGAPPELAAPGAPGAPPELGAPGAPPAPGAKRAPGAITAPTTTTSPVPGPVPAPVPGIIARSIARPVLAAVGINADAAQIQTTGGQTSVSFSPTVAGLSVLGQESSVSIDEHRQIVDASGWLATSTTGPSYPLISARQAYNQLLHQPRPMMALAMPCRIVAGTDGCQPAPDRVVTGATLGLMQVSTTDQGILLVPAWLFHLRGEPAPMAIVAINGAYLVASGPHPSSRPSTGSGPASLGGAGGTNSGSAITGRPSQGPTGPADQLGVKPAR